MGKSHKKHSRSCGCLGLEEKKSRIGRVWVAIVASMHRLNEK